MIEDLRTVIFSCCWCTENNRCRNHQRSKVVFMGGWWQGWDWRSISLFHFSEWSSVYFETLSFHYLMKIQRISQKKGFLTPLSQKLYRSLIRFMTSGVSHITRRYMSHTLVCISTVSGVGLVLGAVITLLWYRMEHIKLSYSYIIWNARILRHITIATWLNNYEGVFRYKARFIGSHVFRPKRCDVSVPEVPLWISIQLWATLGQA